MKKNTLGLLAGLCVLLTGCGGTKYVNESKKSDNKYSIEETNTLAFKNFKDGAGDFTLTEKSLEEYADGYFSGIFGAGAINGEVKVNETIKSTGTWTVNDSGVYVLKVYSIQVKCSVSGDGAEQYIDERFSARYLGYGEDVINALKENGKVTKEYSDPFIYNIKLNEEEKTYSYSLLPF